MSRAESVDYDRPVQLTEQELKHLPVGYLTMWREMGWRTLVAGKSEAAIRNFHYAAGAYPSDVRTLIGRSYARSRKNLFTKAQADAEKVLAMNDFNKEAIFLQARCQYELQNFEEGLLMFHRGINKRGKHREFVEGRQAVEATLENTVGRHSGPMLTDLQPYVNALVQKQHRDAALASKQIKEDCLAEKQIKNKCESEEWRRLQIKEQQKKQRMSSAYLGRLDEDRQWCQQLVDRNVQDRRTDALLHKLATDALQEANFQLHNIQARKPIYHFKHKYKACEALRKNKYHELKYRKEVLFHEDMWKHLQTLNKIKGKTLKYIKHAYNIRLLLHKFPSRITMRYLEELCQHVGEFYLDKKSFRAYLTDKENFRRIMCWSGLDPKFNQLRVDYMAQSTDFPFFNSKQWIAEYKKLLSLAETDLEKCWLHHEIGRAYATLLKWDHQIAEANKAVTFARQCNNIVWEINALCMVAKGECQRKDGGEALHVLQQCIQLSAKIHREDVLEYIKVFREELLKKEMKDNEIQGFSSAAIIKKREDAIVRLQESLADKERARNLLGRMKFLSADRRMGLVPGIEAIDPAFKSENKSIIPGGSGGRLGLHPITKRTYYEFLEIHYPFLST